MRCVVLTVDRKDAVAGLKQLTKPLHRAIDSTFRPVVRGKVTKITNSACSSAGIRPRRPLHVSELADPRRTAPEVKIGERDRSEDLKRHRRGKIVSREAEPNGRRADTIAASGGPQAGRGGRTPARSRPTSQRLPAASADRVNFSSVSDITRCRNRNGSPPVSVRGGPKTLLSQRGRSLNRPAFRREATCRNRLQSD